MAWRGRVRGQRCVEWSDMADDTDQDRPTAWRSDWGSAVRVDEDLWRIRLRNPRGTLQVNTYVHRGDGELVVIDPGWPWNLDALGAAIHEMAVAESGSAEAALASVDRWLYTHSHIDHMGGAALLQEHSEAPHTALRAIEPHFEQWHAFQDEVSDWSDWLRATFVGEVRDTMLAQQRAESTMVGEAGPAALERVDLFDLGDELQVGSMRLQVVDARGHDPYHVAFWEAERGWLFSGDVIIAAPTPILETMNGDLGAYRETLDRLARLDAELMLPGHGLHRRGELENMYARSRSFLDEYRRGVLEQLESAGQPRSIYQLGIAMTPFGDPLKPRDRWWVHLGLIDSHLRELAQMGEVGVVDGEPPMFCLM